MNDQLLLLKNAATEIKNLRRQNELMSARLQMFDSIISIFNAEPPRHGYSHSPDIVWDIEKVLTQQEEADKAPISTPKQI